MDKAIALCDIVIQSEQVRWVLPASESITFSPKVGCWQPGGREPN